MNPKDQPSKRPASDDAKLKALREQWEARLDVLNQPDSRERIERVFLSAGRLKNPVKVPDTY